MKDFYGWFIMTRIRLSKNYWKLINLSQYTSANPRIRKLYRNISPPIVRQLFLSRNNDYNLREFSQFELPKVGSFFCGTESISFLGLKIWNIAPNEFKKEISLRAFKELITKWQLENCPCRLCKSYI